MDSSPLFSFIIPTFNRADIICEALESVRLEKINSGFSLEVLIADDFSSDQTCEQVRGWCKKNNIDWVYYERLAEKGGVCKARNNGVARARGEYLIFLDSDDQILPDSLAHIKSFFGKNKSVDIYYGAIQKKSGRLGYIPSSSYLERPLDYERFISLKGAGEYLHVCKRSLVENANLRFCEKINGFESYLWMKALQQGAKLWIDPRHVRLYDDLRSDRLCHPSNLAKDTSRLAKGFFVFFKEFGDSIYPTQPQYWNALLLRVIFYNKASNAWNAEMSEELQEALGSAVIKVKLIACMPNAVIRWIYPFLNRLRESRFLNSFK